MNPGKWIAYTGTLVSVQVEERCDTRPAVLPSLITGPLGLVLYGIGIQNKMHYMIPTLGIGLANFTVVSSVVPLVYAVDSYKPISEEVITCILGYKAIFAFLIAFYTNDWIMQEGYSHAFGEMAAISGGAFLLVLPFYIWGRRIRQTSLKWKVFRAIQWNSDRDDLVLEDD